jgi:hypothetical protein
MTQLVLHTGTPMTYVPEIQAALVGWREPLSKAGVIVAGQDSTDTWDQAVEKLLSGAPPPPLRKLIRQSVRFGARTVLLSSEAGFRPLRKGRNIEQVTDFAAANELTVRMVVAVREQLDLFNALYCRQVMALETSADFETFVSRAVNSGSYHYAEVFRALLDAENIEVAAVPYSRLSGADPGQVILRESGVEEDVLQGLPTATAGDDAGQAANSPGPVLLAATRLLHKRLIRLGLARDRRPMVFNRAVGLLRANARVNGWDHDEFWGWSAELAASTAESFRHSNAEFAAGAWRSDWPDPPPSRPQTKADLASRSPGVVADVMDSVQRAVELLMAKSDKPAERGLRHG